MQEASAGEGQLRARVSGRVQGVGFRFFVQREATRLGLCGWVRNTADGDVELVARGSRQALGELVKALWEGPALARVHNVAVTWEEPDPGLKRFEVRSTAW